MSPVWWHNRKRHKITKASGIHPLVTMSVRTTCRPNLVSRMIEMIHYICFKAVISSLDKQ